VSPDRSRSHLRRGHRLAGLTRVVVGRIELASALGDVLVVAGWHGVDPAAPGVAAYPDATRIDAQLLELDDPPPELTPPVAGTGARAFLALLPVSLPTGPIVIGLGTVGMLLLPEHLEGALVDLPTLVEGTVMHGDTRMRAAAANFLALAVPANAGPQSSWIGQQIRATNELLIDRLPGVVISPSVPLGLCVDQLLGLDERTFYLRGWARLGIGTIGGLRLMARSPEGARVDLDDVLVRFPRPDVEAFYEAPAGQRESGRSGFLACVRLPAPSRISSGWVVELRDEAGNACEAPAPDVLDDPDSARATILGDLATMESLPGADRPGRRLMSALAHPALSALQRRRCGPRAVAEAVTEVIDHGSVATDPEVSVVVPLYGRIDFLEHQIAAFSADPELRRAELIYVLDSPELAGAARRLAQDLLALHGVAFRLVFLRRNLGFAGATNAGVSVATGRLILLLNSDVLPDRPGWLSRLVSGYDAIEDIGAVGPKLLYEDDSIQHAGMWFEKPQGSSTWANLHYYKGLHRRFPPANVARPVPGITGACLLMDRRLYSEIGGLAGAFVQGDFEDSDLCLRLRARGRSCWYLPEVELYHLEGQSYPDELRRTVAAYNGWLQTSTWDAELTEVMAEHDGVTPPLRNHHSSTVPQQLRLAVLH
jgi:GT2 family glycosyltransferase